MSTNIFEELRVDHDKQRELLKKLVKTTGHTAEREELFSDLKKNLEDHAKYEERFLYAELMQQDMTMDKARHSVHEHQEIDKKIDKLSELDFSSPQWLAEARNLQELVEHHLEEEEHGVFQLSGKVLSEEQKQSLGESFHKAMHI